MILTKINLDFYSLMTSQECKVYLSEAGFDLRKWESNSQVVSKEIKYCEEVYSINTEDVLGRK